MFFKNKDNLKLCPNSSKKNATRKTKQINLNIYNNMDWNRIKAEKDLAQKGMLYNAHLPVIRRKESGVPVWDLRNYKFLFNKQIPSTVNPKLWVQGNLNLNVGLFKVTDHIYQVRGYDAANMTFIKGDRGWIIIDSLTCKETAEAAIELVNEHLEKRPISAVIITHSHTDHYGGSLEVIERLADEDTRFYVPENYVNTVFDENVYVGVAMYRRAKYQYGIELHKDAKGQVDIGIGKGISTGTVGFSQNVTEIKREIETKDVDGLKMEFLLAQDTESPAQMFVYIADEHSLCIAEDCNATFHNLLTLRGAKVRNPVAWANSIDKAIDKWGKHLTSVFGVHTWPRFGNKECIDYMEKQRDLYQYIHDQTLRLMNKGYTLDDVGRSIKVPNSLADEWYNSGFYGTVNHNAKAVYQRYLGWYNSNPVDLNRLFPEESAKKYVDYMGGEKKILRKAKKAFEKGEYQWVAEVTKQVIYADPMNSTAKLICADALEQLGYVCESGTWRNEYLMGAWELRHGIIPSVKSYITEGVLNNLDLKDVLNLLSIRLDGYKAGDLDFKMNFVIKERREEAFTEVKRGIFRYLDDHLSDDATITVVIPKEVLYQLVTTNDPPDTSKITVFGDVAKWNMFLSLIDKIDPDFHIMTPVNKQ